MFAQDVFERLGLSQDTDLLNDLQKEALLEPTEAAQSPYMDDPAYAGFETLRGLFGSNHGDNPSMYWLAQGKEMPEFATVADAQAAVWKDFQKKPVLIRKSRSDNNRHGRHWLLRLIPSLTGMCAGTLWFPPLNK